MAAVNRKQCMEVIGSKLDGVTSVPVVATIIDKSKLTFGATVQYTDGSDTVTATVCSNNGKVKVYANAGDIIKDVAQSARGAVSVALTTNVEALSVDVISLYPEKQLVKDKARNKADLDRQTAVVAKLDEQLVAIDDYDGGNSAQQAFYDKFAAERVIANALKTYFAELPQP